MQAPERYPFRMRYVLIMAGGSGKRLWPLSRQGMPKQLLRVVGGKSLLRIAYDRLEGIVPADHVLVCTGADYADVVAAELPEVKPANILGEPEGRDSLNAVAWPAAVLAARDPAAVVAVVTADHIMHPVSAFQSALLEGFEVAESAEDLLVTFGVVPTAPHTGYGYLRRGETIPDHPDVFSVIEFKEKPDRATAEEYLISGEYWWNSGMFVWRARTLLDQLKMLQPKTHDAVVELAAAPYRLSEIYPELLKISVDYAVMEPVSRGQGSARVVAVRLPITWHDVGGFAALGEQLPRDEHRNATHGVAVLVDARDNLVINNTEGRVVAVVGLSDTVIVQTPQITLVCPISEAERIKELVAEVTTQLGSSYA
jgi:mannose-1-phosphate guanylyltransferase